MDLSLPKRPLSVANPILGPSAYPAVVLHIEDDESVARAVARFLRLKGYEVVSAASGPEAIQLIENGLVPDLILTDYLLPLRMTGDRVVMEIQTRLGFNPPTIMLASVPHLEIERIGSLADCVFDKPADMKVLLQAIESLLGANLTVHPAAVGH
jgi:CheY-like chemotaxis protein